MQSQKTRSAPLGATYKQDVPLRWPRPSQMPLLAELNVFCLIEGYKDFAPMELGQELGSLPGASATNPSV
jgi:hypothetical protein